MKGKRINNLLKVFVFTFLLIVGMQLFANVHAAINTEYGEQEEQQDVDLDKKIEASPLLDYVGAFIYALGNIAEHVTSGILSLAGAGNIFPWADKVIFNTIPILDVNFINPDKNSLLSDGTLGIGEVVRNVYFSGISIALGFFGIIVAVLAIRLAISTIGSEKAKYKEAITKWLSALVLLFGMHFVLAFLFFLNENLVVVASQMLDNQIAKNGKIITEKMNALYDEQSDDIVENFISKAWDSICKGWNLSWDTMKKEVNTIRNGNIAEEFIASFKVTVANADLASAVIYFDEMKSFESYCNSHQDLCYALISSKTVRSELLDLIQGNCNKASWGDRTWSWIKSGTIINGFKNDKVAQIRAFKETMQSCVSGDIHQEVVQAIKDKKSLSELTNGKGGMEKELLTLSYNYEKYGSATHPAYSPISLLGEYFRTAAWYIDVDNNGWSPDQVSIIAAILYTMFVFQSISFFIAYVKRFFYVVILSILAPFVVLYDFLAKSVNL